MDLTAILFALVAMFVVYLWYRWDDPRLPPCPVTPLPIIGHVLHLRTNPRCQLQQWRKECGDIFTLYMGQSRAVVLSGYELLKETFVKNGDLTSDRPFYLFAEATGKGNMGVAFTSGPLWKEQREVTLSILRSLGMGKNVLAERIIEIVEDLIQSLHSLKGKPIVLKPIISISVANVICSIVVGRRFKHDENFIKVVESMRLNFVDGGSTNLVNYFPFLRYVPGDLFAAKRMRARAGYIMDVFVEKYIQEMKSGESTENFITEYLQEKNKRLRTGKLTTLSDDNLRRTIYDLLAGGMDTTAATIDWAILYLIHYPNIQEKLHKEMDEEIGSERIPTLSDKVKLPYLNAFIQETQRKASISPLSLTHMNNKEMAVGGYTIPKGTHMIINLDSVLWDQKIWGQDADKFRPERFLDEQGKIQSPEMFIPFSLGKRLCVGESLAKMELFLFLGALIHRFQFLPEDSAALPSMKATFGISANPLPYKVKVVDRITNTTY